MGLEKMPNRPGSERKAELEDCPQCSGTGRSSGNVRVVVVAAAATPQRPIGRYVSVRFRCAAARRVAQGSNLFCREASRIVRWYNRLMQQQEPLRTSSLAGRGSAVRRNRRPFALPTTTWRSCASSRVIASCARPTSRRWSAARSIAPTIACRGSFTPATSTGRAPSSTTTRPPDRRRSSTRSPTAARGFLIERDGIDFANVEWSRKNREAGRPFIEHQLEIMDFCVALQCAARQPRRPATHSSGRIRRELSRPARQRPQSLCDAGRALACAASLHDIGVVPDLRVRLGVSRRVAPLLHRRDRSRHHAGRAHRFLADELRAKDARLSHRVRRASSTNGSSDGRRFACLPSPPTRRASDRCMEALRKIRVPHSPGPSLFLFLTAANCRELRSAGAALAGRHRARRV